jgi:hypothetical protein
VLGVGCWALGRWSVEVLACWSVEVLACWGVGALSR